MLKRVNITDLWSESAFLFGESCSLCHDDFSSAVCPHLQTGVRKAGNFTCFISLLKTVLESGKYKLDFSSFTVMKTKDCLNTMKKK